MEIIKYLIEVIAILLLVYGYTQEERIIAWERELYKVLKQYYRKRVKKSAKMCVLRETYPRGR